MVIVANGDRMSLQVGQWVQALDGSVGYVETADGPDGPYQIRLLSHWADGLLPTRSGEDFLVLDIPARFYDQARQIADELWHLLSPKR